MNKGRLKGKKRTHPVPCPHCGAAKPSYQIAFHMFLCKRETQ